MRPCMIICFFRRSIEILKCLTNFVKTAWIATNTFNLPFQKPTFFGYSFESFCKIHYIFESVHYGCFASFVKLLAFWKLLCWLLVRKMCVFLTWCEFNLFTLIIDCVPCALNWLSSVTVCCQ